MLWSAVTSCECCPKQKINKQIKSMKCCFWTVDKHSYYIPDVDLEAQNQFYLHGFVIFNL